MIPGTKRVQWPEEHVAALDVTLAVDELVVLGLLAGQITGAQH